MTLGLYRAIFVEIHALFPKILQFEFVTGIMNHPVYDFGLYLTRYIIYVLETTRNFNLQDFFNHRDPLQGCELQWKKKIGQNGI